MEDLVRYIVSNLTEKEDVEIIESQDGDRTVYTVMADQEDMGLLIGKQGNTIRSIRNLVRVRATLDKTLVYLNIEEKGAQPSEE